MKADWPGETICGNCGHLHQDVAAVQRCYEAADRRRRLRTRDRWLFAAVVSAAAIFAFSVQGCGSAVPLQLAAPAPVIPVVSPVSTPAVKQPVKPGRAAGRQYPGRDKEHSSALARAAGLAQIADEGRVTYSVTLAPGECHARGLLPDPACTPGSADPAVTQATIGQTICADGWTETARPPSSETSDAKFAVAYPAYSLAEGTRSELDHLIPLELGGSNDITNLWPEAGGFPNPKDYAENDLRADVCNGELTLAAARAAIARNWLAVP